MDFQGIDDSELENIPMNSCSMCKHLNTDTGYEPPFICKAFPGGIPDEIWEGKNDHRKQLEGDHGIQFEKKG